MLTRVEHRPNDPSVVHLTPDATTSVADFHDAFVLALNAGTDSPVWLHGTEDRFAEVLREGGYDSNRTLLQLRVSLPMPPTELTTRGFTEDDIDDVVTLNNRAFDWHPEQGGLTADEVRRDMASDWFVADGFRLHHIDDRLAGFCWTKQHAEPEVLGEIYVIALDPDFHGRGLGSKMTQAGLDWLAAAGHTTGMLYVESDNEPAVATYRRLGFSTHRTDTLWRRRP